MRILVFMPRNMRFGPTNATSIDLCAKELISASRYRDTTKIVCCKNESLFPGFDITSYAPSIDANKFRKVAFAIKEARDSSANLIVIHNHLPTAAALARRTSIPVLLHKHNMTKGAPKSGLVNALRRRLKLAQYRALAGIIFVSEACRANFLSHWSDVRVPTAVVYNGLNLAEWSENSERRNEIICVGRATPEKGLLEAAQAIKEVLHRYSSWNGRLILSEPEKCPDYTRAIFKTAEQFPSRLLIESNQPFEVVQVRVKQAAIAIVPSRWQEPFGRTALEAHAAGCAVISSGTGGLAEISKNFASYLPSNFKSSDITREIEKLINDHGTREQLSRAGQQYCHDKFSLANVAAQADLFYEQIANLHTAIS